MTPQIDVVWLGSRHAVRGLACGGCGGCGGCVAGLPCAETQRQRLCLQEHMARPSSTQHSCRPRSAGPFTSAANTGSSQRHQPLCGPSFSPVWYDTRPSPRPRDRAVGEPGSAAGFALGAGGCGVGSQRERRLEPRAAGVPGVPRRPLVHGCDPRPGTRGGVG